MLGLETTAFWLMIGAPAIVIAVMFFGCLKIKGEERD